jgi:hypothetical protein
VTDESSCLSPGVKPIGLLVFRDASQPPVIEDPTGFRKPELKRTPEKTDGILRDFF